MANCISQVSTFVFTPHLGHGWPKFESCGCDILTSVPSSLSDRRDKKLYFFPSLCQTRQLPRATNALTLSFGPDVSGIRSGQGEEEEEESGGGSGLGGLHFRPSTALSRCGRWEATVSLLAVVTWSPSSSISTDDGGGGDAAGCGRTQARRVAILRLTRARQAGRPVGRQARPRSVDRRFLLVWFPLSHRRARPAIQASRTHTRIVAASFIAWRQFSEFDSFSLEGT